MLPDLNKLKKCLIAFLVWMGAATALLIAILISILCV